MKPLSIALFAAFALLGLTGSAHAQGGFVWNDNGTVESARPRTGAPPAWGYATPPPFWDWQRPPRYGAPNDVQMPPPSQGEIRDGGARPEIAPTPPPVVAFSQAYPANSIVIATDERHLYYVLPGNRAYVYQISVGREGFDWYGVEKVSRKQAWPDWHPPVEMRQRDPRLPEKMTGGVKNPLGAVALYLGTTLYRIHGTNDERSLGQAQSSGCFRMMNSSAVHLASITEVGTTVQVVKSLQPDAVSRAEPTPTPAVRQPPAPLPRSRAGYDVREEDRYGYAPPPGYSYRSRRDVWSW